MNLKSCRSNDQDIIAYQAGKENVELEVTRKIETMKSEFKNNNKLEEKLSNFDKLFTNRKWPALKQTQHRNLAKTVKDVLEERDAKAQKMLNLHCNSASKWTDVFFAIKIFLLVLPRDSDPGISF